MTEININKINGITALRLGKTMQDAYLRSILCPQMHDKLYPRLMEELGEQKNIDLSIQAIRAWNELGIRVISIHEEIYPQKLKSIHKPPPILFLLGNEDRLLALKESLAIVGSRKADSFGCDFAADCGRFAAEHGICVISGLALGVDSFAHKGSLRSTSGFPTIAVLGNGLKEIYPAANFALAKEILAKGGLIISQFEPGTPPYRNNFLDRNRLIAGLSDALLVIQAPKRSGSLSTARHALEEGRDLLVVPGDISDKRYEGSNDLIRQGAYLISNKTEILEYFPGINSAEVENRGAYMPACPEQAKLFGVLKKERKVHLEKLEALFPEKSKLAGMILELELQGILRQGPGNYISLINK